MDKKKIIKLGYNIYISLFSVLILILFIYQVLDIYNGGKGQGQIYTPAIIKEHFQRIDIFVYLYLVSLVISFPLNSYLKIKENNFKYSNLERIDIMTSNIEVNKIDNEYQKEYLKMEKSRKIYLLVTSLISLIMGLIVLIYALNKNHFMADDITKEMLNFIYFALPFLAISFLGFSSYHIFNVYNSKKKLDLVIKMRKGVKIEKKKVKNPSKEITIVRIVSLSLVIIFIILGIINGDVKDVLVKACAICRECIGIG